MLKSRTGDLAATTHDSRFWATESAIDLNFIDLLLLSPIQTSISLTPKKRTWHTGDGPGLSIGLGWVVLFAGGDVQADDFVVAGMLDARRSVRRRTCHRRNGAKSLV
jgi:hypothetical protein